MDGYARRTRSPWSTRPLAVGDRVEVRRGPARGMTGSVVDAPANYPAVRIEIPGIAGVHAFARRNLRRVR